VRGSQCDAHCSRSRESAAMQHIQAARGSASAAVDAAKNKASETAGVRATEMATAAGARATGMAGAGLDKAKSAAQGVVGQAAEKANDVKALLVKLVLKKVHAQIEKLVNRFPGIIKNGIEDPDMPRCISRGKDRMIDAVWPDIKEEIMFEMAAMLDGVSAEKSENNERKGPCCFQAFWRWHIFPYNKSIWGKLRDPFFLFFKFVSLIPLQGVCPGMFFFIFLMIDKKDEFQLIFFILQFKGTQFLSHGIIRTIVGFFMFINCVSVPADDASHDCAAMGPGSPGEFIIPLVGFLVQVVLVWLAFALLPCSVERGRTVLGATAEEIRASRDTEEKKGATAKGGYIRYFLYYDLVCALVCFAAVAYVISTRDTYDDWPVRHALYGAQVVYGYLSMPFFIFTIPILQNVLTHAVPTGYDPQGRCHKLKSPDSVVEAKRERARKLEEERLKAEGVVSQEDTNEFLTRMKSLFGLPDAMMPDFSKRSSVVPGGGPVAVAPVGVPAATSIKEEERERE